MDYGAGEIDVMMIMMKLMEGNLVYMARKGLNFAVDIDYLVGWMSQLLTYAKQFLSSTGSIKGIDRTCSCERSKMITVLLPLSLFHCLKPVNRAGGEIHLTYP